MKLFNKLFGVNFFTAILFFITGLILIVYPEGTIKTISFLLGALLIVSGINSIVKYFNYKYQFDLITGVLSTIAALLLIFNPIAIASILPIILGIYFIISAFTKLRYAIDIKKYNNKDFLVMLISSLLVLIFGVLLLVNPFGGAKILTQIIGYFILAYSILDIISYFALRKNVTAIERYYNDK